MRFSLLKIVLLFTVSFLFSCSKKNTATNSGTVKVRPTAKESFKIPKEFTEPPKKKGNTKAPSSRGTGVVNEDDSGKKKKKKATYAKHRNEFVENRKKELLLEAEEKWKNPKYNDPTHFGEDEDIYKKNGKIKKKYAHPPYVMNPKYNLSDKEREKKRRKAKEKEKKGKEKTKKEKKKG